MRLAPSALRSLAASLLAVGCLAPHEVAAQSGCHFAEGSGTFRQVTLAGGSQMFYLGEPHLVCGDGVEIWADSAVAYVSQNMSHFLGSVRFEDSARELRSDEARYFTRLGRLQAQGSLIVRDLVQGSIIENGDLVYLRKTDFREEDQMTFRTWVDGIRPTALLYMKPSEPDSAQAAAEAAATAAGEAAEAAERVPARTPALRDSSSLSFAPRDTPAIRDSSSISMVLTDTAVARVPLPVEIAIAPGPADTVPGAAAVPEAEAVPAEPDTVPYRVTGNEIFLQGNEYFRATGDVVIERDSITAFGQVAEYDQVAGRILLERQARVETSTYELKGRVINIGMENGAMRNIRALRDGILTGDDLVLTAPLIHLFLDDGAMERLVAMPMQPDPDSVAAGVPVDSTMLERPVAVAEEFSLIADSLDVRSPEEVLQRIIAVGNARGESKARDSLNVEILPEIARSDWLEGDTVIASFGEVLVVDTTTATGTRTDYRLEQLEARSEARSLYRLEPTDTTKEAGVDPPAVHYVTGQQILIVLEDGEVDHMDVTGQTRGFHLEPLKLPTVDDSLAVDSLAVDSLAVDSLAVDSLARPDTTRPDTAAATRPPVTPPPTLSPRGQGSPDRSRRPDPFNRSRRPW